MPLTPIDPPRPNQRHLFLSYCRREADFARRLAADLLHQDIPVWYDDFLATGQVWGHELEQSIDTAAGFLAVLSPAYSNSEYCRIELLRARTAGLPIYPLLLREFESPNQRPLEVQDKQHLLFTGWPDETKYRTHLQTLIQELKAGTSLQLGGPQERERRYLEALIASLQQDRGVLEYVELDAQGEEEAQVRPSPLPIDEWGYSLMLDNPSPGEPRQRYGSLSELVGRHPRVALLGDPGSGKTTSLRHLALATARARLRKTPNTPIPYFVSLPEWGDQPTAAEFLGARWPFSRPLEECLEAGEVIVLLDGLNELGTRGPLLAGLVAGWLKANPVGQVMVACRERDYQGDLRLAGLAPVELGELNPEQIRKFAANYLRDRAADFLAAAVPQLLDPKSQPSGLEDLARNPYLLGALVFLYAAAPDVGLPSNHGQLLGKLATALWAREGKRQTRGWRPAEHTHPAFARLAFQMIEQGLPSAIPETEAIAALGDPELLRLGVSANFIAWQDHRIRFSHQLVQEYFAAVHWRTRDASGVVAEPRWSEFDRRETRWDGVIVAYSGIVPEPTAAVRAIATKDVHLATRCVASGVTVSEDLRTELASQLTSRLADHHIPRLFATLRSVQELGHPSSIPVVAHRLPHLLSIDPAGILGHWAGRTLAALGPEAIPTLVTLLRRADVRIKMTAIDALVCLGETAVPTLAGVLSSDAHWTSKLYAVDGLSVLATTLGSSATAGETARKWLIAKGVSHPVAYVRQHSASMLGHMRCHEAIPALRKLLLDPSPPRTPQEQTVSQAARAALAAIEPEAPSQAPPSTA